MVYFAAGFSSHLDLDDNDFGPGTGAATPRGGDLQSYEDSWREQRIEFFLYNEVDKIGEIALSLDYSHSPIFQGS